MINFLKDIIILVIYEVKRNKEFIIGILFGFLLFSISNAIK